MNMLIGSPCGVQVQIIERHIPILQNETQSTFDFYLVV